MGSAPPSAPSDPPPRSRSPFFALKPPTPFVGRSLPLDQITQAFGRRSRVVIAPPHASPSTPLGSGRSSLAAAFAHAFQEAFPDGVFWVPARTFDPLLIALRLARQLGGPALVRQLEPDPVRAFAQLLSLQRALVVLDDLADVRVLSLIPPSFTQLLVTADDPAIARSPRTTLVQLPPFSVAEAESLLQQLIGLDRWKLEPVAAKELCALLHHHPLCIRLALAPLLEHPPQSGPGLSLLVRSLRHQLARMHRQHGERRWAGATLALALDPMLPDDRATLLALSTLPARSFSRAAAASVAALPEDALQEQLDRFFRLGLVTALPEERLSIHPLLVPSMLELGPGDEPRSRAASFYLSYLLSNGESVDAIDHEIEGILGGMATALELGEAHMVRDFALALGPYFDARGYTEEVVRRLHMGLAAARHTRDTRAEGRLNRWLGRLFYRKNAPEAARDRFTAALDHAQEVGDKTGRVTTLLDLGRMEASQDRLSEALSALEQALTITAGRMGEEGYVLLELARVLIRLERKDDALKSLEGAATWARKRKDPALEQATTRLRASISGGAEAVEAALANVRDTAEMVARFDRVLRPDLPGRNDPQRPDAQTPDATSPPLPLPGLGLSNPNLLRPGPLPTPSPSDVAQEPVRPIEPPPVSEAPEPSPGLSEPFRAQVLSSSLETARSLLTPSLESGLPAEQLEAAELLASLETQAGNSREAEAALTRGAEVAARTGQVLRAAGFIEQAGELLRARGQTDVALRYLERAFRLRETAGDRLVAARTLHQMGQLAVDAGDYDTALYHHLRSLDRLPPSSDGQTGAVARADALFRLGMIFAARGEEQEARTHFDLAEEHWLEARDLQGIALVFQARGRLDARKGEVESARRSFIHAIELAEGLGDTRLQAAVLHQLGLLLSSTQELDAAEATLRQSLHLKRSHPDLRGMAITLHALAGLMASRHRTQEARTHYARVLELARELGNSRLQASTLRALADCMAAEDHPSEALQTYDQAYRLMSGMTDKRERSALHRGRGAVLAELERYAEAIAELTKSLELARELQDRTLEAATHYQLGLACAEKGEDDRAIAHLQQSFELDEKLGNARGAAVSLSMLGQMLSIVGMQHDGTALLQEAARRMETLQMPELEKVREWLASA